MPKPQPSKNESTEPNAAALGELSADKPLTKRPIGVVVAAIIVGLEALALLAAGVMLLTALFTQPQQSMASSIFLVVLVIGIAIALGAVGLNFFKGYRWTRSAVFVWQLLIVAIAFPAFSSGAPILGAVMASPAIAVAVLLFTPTVVQFTLRTGQPDKTL